MADRTKLWIAEHMKALMRTKPLAKIRVSELCELAEIERSTFYYHFKDKYDLVAWIFYQSAYGTDIISVEEAAASMRQVKADMLYYKNAYADTSKNALWEYMLEYYVEGYARIARELLGHELDQQLKLSVRLYCYGAMSVTKEWVLSNDDTTAEDMVKMMFASMPPQLHELYFGQEVT